MASEVNKILPLLTLASLLKRKRGQIEGWSIVQCHGCFDLLHYGHIEHLKQAKAMGGYLVVTVTADQFVNKGPGRPTFTQEQRATHLAALEMVDYVAIVDGPTAIPAIGALRPQIYCKGPDYEGRKDGVFAQEKARVEEFGGQVVFTRGKTMSSSQLINEHIMPQGMRDFVALAKQHDVLGWMDKLAGIKALVLGEAIVDEYVFVTPEGKSAKESIVCFRELRAEKWPGGAQAVAAHLENLCGSSRLFTGGAESILKRRYVLEPFGTKLFHVVDRARLTKCWDISLGSLVESDMVVVADFGHGFFAPPSIMRIAEASPFLALTVQSNSLNWGFNLLDKWPRADYVACDEDELRLVCRDKTGDLAALAQAKRKCLGARLLAVTRGHLGCLMAHDDGVATCPPMADRVVDTLGAGDAFFAASSVFAYLGAPPEVVALAGSVAAAIEVGQMGNVPLDGRVFRKFLEGVLK